MIPSPWSLQETCYGWQTMSIGRFFGGGAFSRSGLRTLADGSTPHNQEPAPDVVAMCQTHNHLWVFSHHHATLIPGAGYRKGLGYDVGSDPASRLLHGAAGRGVKGPRSPYNRRTPGCLPTYPSMGGGRGESEESVGRLHVTSAIVLLANIEYRSPSLPRGREDTFRAKAGVGFPPFGCRNIRSHVSAGL